MAPLPLPIWQVSIHVQPAEVLSRQPVLQPCRDCNILLHGHRPWRWARGMRRASRHLTHQALLLLPRHSLRG